MGKHWSQNLSNKKISSFETISLGDNSHSAKGPEKNSFNNYKAPNIPQKKSILTATKKIYQKKE